MEKTNTLIRYHCNRDGYKDRFEIVAEGLITEEQIARIHEAVEKRGGFDASALGFPVLHDDMETYEFSDYKLNGYSFSHTAEAADGLTVKDFVSKLVGGHFVAVSGGMAYPDDDLLCKSGDAIDNAAYGILNACYLKQESKELTALVEDLLSALRCRPDAKTILKAVSDAIIDSANKIAEEYAESADTDEDGNLDWDMHYIGELSMAAESILSGKNLAFCHPWVTHGDDENDGDENDGDECERICYATAERCAHCPRAMRYRRVHITLNGYAIVPAGDNKTALANAQMLSASAFDIEEITNEVLEDVDVVDVLGPNEEVQ